MRSFLLILLIPLACGQHQDQAITTNQQLRGPILVSDFDVKEKVATNDDGILAAADKVNLIILTEAGCPDCQESIAGPLDEMIALPGFADILNVKQIR